MPDSRSHRGAHPDDAALFASAAWPRLREAVTDLSWLLTRGYADPSALKIVGDRYGLSARQRVAVMRCACSNQAQASRHEREVLPAALLGQKLLIDGYNLLLTVEAALGGGVILQARDGCFRDLASVHGTYRSVEETLPAIQLIGRVLEELSIDRCVWYLDSPVSNSGRLRTILLDAAGAAGWPWDVQVVQNPDTILSSTTSIVATADSVVLDACQWWFNLARRVVHAEVPGALIVAMHGC